MSKEIKVRRLDYGRSRFYYKENDPSQFYKSVTSFAKEILPPSNYLDDWKVNIGVALGGKELGEKYLNLTAVYGTVLDDLTSLMLSGEVIDRDTIYDHILTEMKSKKFLTQYDLVEMWHRQIVRDLLSVRQWFVDVNFELTSLHPMVLIDNRLGGQVDFVGKIDVEIKGDFGEVYKSGPQKGQVKETKQIVRKEAVIDLKSGKAFYDSHEFQLVAYHKGLVQTLGIQPEVLINLAPKDWKGETPTYLVKDQTDTKMWDLYDTYIELGDKQNMFDVSPKFLSASSISLSNSPFEFKTLKQIYDEQNADSSEAAGGLQESASDLFSEIDSAI